MKNFNSFAIFQDFNKNLKNFANLKFAFLDKAINNIDKNDKQHFVNIKEQFKPHLISTDFLEKYEKDLYNNPLENRVENVIVRKFRSISKISIPENIIDIHAALIKHTIKGKKVNLIGKNSDEKNVCYFKSAKNLADKKEEIVTLGVIINDSKEPDEKIIIHAWNDKLDYTLEGNSSIYYPMYELKKLRHGNPYDEQYDYLCNLKYTLEQIRLIHIKYVEEQFKTKFS